MATESDSGAGRPSQPRSAEEFVAELRRLRAQVGLPSFRDLSRVAERRAAASADGRRSEALPPSTTSEILGGKRLPRMPRLEFVESYVAACLATDNVAERLIVAEVARWRDLWRSLADHEDQRPPTMVEVPPQAAAVSPYRRTWITWSTLVSTFVAGIGVGVVGSRLLVDQHPTTSQTDSGDTTANAAGLPEVPAAATCPPPSGASSPVGSDVLRLPSTPAAQAGPINRAATWWTNDDRGVDLATDGRAFDAAVHGGTAKPGDLLIAKRGVSLQQGRHYALAFTATVDRPARILVRVQDSAPPLYPSSYMRHVAATPVACRHTYRFTAAKTSAESELTFQVGGHAQAFRLRVSDVVLVEQNA